MWKVPFFSFWIAKTSITLSDIIYIMVITTIIYQKTNSAIIAALFPLLKAVSNLVAGLLSPLLYEKVPYSKLLVSLQIVKGILLTLLWIGFGHIVIDIPLLLMFVLVISFLEGWVNPLLNTIIPKVVERNELVKANSFLSITNQLVQIAGFSFTGIAVIKWGSNLVLTVNVVFIWLSVLCLFIITKYLSSRAGWMRSNQSKWAVMKEGWRLLWRNSTLRLITIMDVIEGMAGSIWIGAITLVYAKEALNQGEEWWGYINASYYMGSVLGGIFTFFLAKTIQKHLITSMAIGSFLFSIFTFIYGMTSLPLLALFLCVIMGPAYQIRDVAQETAFQTNIPVEQLPKVYASKNILLSVTTSLSIFLMGFISDIIGVRVVYILGSIIIMISALLSFRLVYWNKMLQHVDVEE